MKNSEGAPIVTRQDDRDCMTLGDLARLGRTRPGGMSLKERPYWWDAMGDPAPPPAVPATADVVVVGSGFSGLSAALTLARRGRSVTVLEAGRPGFGASTRNGGQIGSGNQKFRVRTLIGMMGEAKAVALLREGVAMLDHIDALIRDEAIDCHFTRCGRFRGAVRPEHYEAMARDMDDLRHFAGVESFAVPRSEQHREIGTDVFYGGSVLPQDGGLHPGKYHAGLMARATAAGATVVGEAAVTRIERDGAGFRVTTPRGTVRAGGVILATNGYTGRHLPYVGKRMVPVGSALIATAPLPESILQGVLPTGRMYGNTARVFSYFRAAPDSPRLVWGGRVGRLHRGGAASAYAHLARDMLRVFPGLAHVRVSHGWSGQIGYTFDEFPHLGRTPDGIHYAMGYCGTGVSRSTYFGHKIALQLLGDPEGRTAFDDIAFPSHPFHAAAAAAVPAVETWYRLRDATNL